MAEEKMEVTILGCRGSLPVSAQNNSIYGCATTAYQIRYKGELLLLDAGSGILNMKGAAGYKENTGYDLPEEICLFLTHAHIDHVIGLPYLLSFCRGRRLKIRGPVSCGKSVEDQLRQLMSPPLWPVGIEDYPDLEVEFHDLDRQVYKEGLFTVSRMASRHPGGSCIYRVEAGGKSLVLATDFEHGGGPEDGLAAFTGSADLLLYDGQYTEKEYSRRKGFGHSTAAEGLRIFLKSGARRLLIVHHEPMHTDEMLSEMEAALIKLFHDRCRTETLSEKSVGFAKEGEVILL